MKIATLVLAAGLVVGAAARGEVVAARSTARFLDSIGIDTTFPDRGQPLEKTVEMIRYGGFRWVRGGIEGLKENGPTTLGTYLELHEKTGVKFSWGLVSGGTDLEKLLTTARTLAGAGALLAFEGNNEPNNWGVNYKGEEGGGKAKSWMAVAKLQRDLYAAVKGDAVLNGYSVWSISENGAEADDVGLQFLTIPAGAGALMPDGTRFADCANVHNYIYHPASPHPMENKTWNAAEPGPGCKVDGLYGNYGRTWGRHFAGYSESELASLPKVTTETGCTIDGEVTEEMQGLNLLSMYLDQFKRGWNHTSVYLLRDRTDEGGNQSFGFFDRDYKPRKAAVYLHNLTTILGEGEGREGVAEDLNYIIDGGSGTVHDLLLENGEGVFQLIVWDERLAGKDKVAVKLQGKKDSVVVYDPTVGVKAVRPWEWASEIDLTLSNHPVVVEIGAKP